MAGRPPRRSQLARQEGGRGVGPLLPPGRGPPDPHPGPVRSGQRGKAKLRLRMSRQGRSRRAAFRLRPPRGRRPGREARPHLPPGGNPQPQFRAAPHLLPEPRQHQRRLGGHHQPGTAEGRGQPPRPRGPLPAPGRLGVVPPHRGPERLWRALGDPQAGGALRALQVPQGGPQVPRPHGRPSDRALPPGEGRRAGLAPLGRHGIPGPDPQLQHARSPYAAPPPRGGPPNPAPFPHGAPLPHGSHLG